MANTLKEIFDRLEGLTIEKIEIEEERTKDWHSIDLSDEGIEKWKENNQI